MVDIIDNKWTELDNANISASPDGVQGGYAPTTVAPIIRAIRGAIKREFVSTSPLKTSTGTATAYALTFEQPLTILKGKRISFWPHIANTGAATINLNATGTRQIVRPDGTALQAGDIRVGFPVDLVADGTRYILSSVQNLSDYSGAIKASSFYGNGANVTALNASNISSGTINDARLPATQTGKSFTSAVTIGSVSSSAGILNIDSNQGQTVPLINLSSFAPGISFNDRTTGAYNAVENVDANLYRIWSAVNTDPTVLTERLRLNLTNGNLTLNGFLDIASGGTGATTAAAARTNLGLGNVNNTTDAAKPISTATQTALNLKVNVADIGNSAAKNFYYGTAVPAASFGANGDIYFRYE